MTESGGWGRLTREWVCGDWLLEERLEFLHQEHAEKGDSGQPVPAILAEKEIK